jgi:hypothetical protein
MIFSEHVDVMVGKAFWDLAEDSHPNSEIYTV